MMGFYVFENHVLVLLLISVLSRFCLWKCHSENQGPWAASEIEGWAAEPAQGSQGGAFPPPRRQGHRRCTQQALQDVLSLTLSLVLFSKGKVFVSDIVVFFLGNTERWWGCRLHRCWRWYRRSRRRLWGKFTRRRSTCLSICVPRRPGPFGEGLPSTRYI